MIEARLNDTGDELAIRIRCKDAVGIIAGLAREVDEANCWFHGINFFVEGIHEDKCGIDAMIHGREKLADLRDAIHGEDIESLVDSNIAELKRQDTAQGVSGIWFVKCTAVDRPGITECTARAISLMLGNFVWLHAHTDADGGDSRFELIAAIAFNKMLRAGMIRDNIITAFSKRDDEDNKAGRRGNFDPLTDCNVIVHKLST